MSFSVIAYALVALLVFFLLIGKFTKCCCYRCFGDDMTPPPYYVYPNPMPIRNATSERDSPCPNYANAAATSTIAAGQTHTRNTTSQRSPCPTYDNAVATTTITVVQPFYDFASPRSDLRCPTTYNSYPTQASLPPPPSYCEDPPPSYDQVCGITNSINEHQSRKI